MKLCICTSTFSNLETLDIFIDSLLLQTYTDWELNICNDNNEEKYISKITNYAKDKRIKIINNPENLGLTISLIKLIDKLPNNAYILRMDDDEIHSSEYLISIANLFQRGHDLIIYTEHPLLGWLIKKLHCKNPYIASLFFCLTGNIATHGGIAFKKDCYMNSNGYSREFRYSQDYNLLIKMLKVAKNPYFTNALNFKPFEVERSFHKVSRDNKNMQKIFSLIAIIGLIDDKYINKYINFFYFIILLICSIPIKFIRSILSR